MSKSSPSKYWRIAPDGGTTTADCSGKMLPTDAVGQLRPRHAVLLAKWDETMALGQVGSLGIVRRVDVASVAVDWIDCAISLRPNPAGRRWWTQAKPFFGFAPDVVARYGFDDLFAEHFPEFSDLAFESTAKALKAESKPSLSPTGGYVYVIRSQHGFKIGKTVNLKQRTRIFEVKLPFKNSLEHYAWFEDYTHAERSFHLEFHSKRLEGEWFDLTPEDLVAIKSKGLHVALDGLR